MNEKSDSTNQNLDCSSNMNSGIKTEMDSSGYDVGFSHLPQVQRIVKLERESSFGKYCLPSRWDIIRTRGQNWF